MADNVFEVIVVREWLKTELVLEGDGKGRDEIEAGDFGNQILLALFTWTLFGMYPDQSSEVVGGQSKLCPVLSTFVVTLVCCRTAETESQTDDETEDCEKKLIDAQIMYEFRDASDHSRPSTNEEQR